MLRFFRFNDPYRLLFVFAVVLLLGIKAEFEFPSITTPELNGILVGEMLADGKRMYSEVWDSMPPVTAYTQRAFDFMMGRSTTWRHVISWLLIAFQAAFFGILLINNRAFNESNYLPSLLFSVLAFFSFDTVSFTREILGSTLLLFAMNNLLKEVEFKKQHDETIHNLGLYLGLASLSVFSYLIFFIGTAVLLFIFTRIEPRRFLLFLFGFLLPHFLLNTWYYWNGELSLLWKNFYIANVEWDTIALVSLKSLLILTTLPLAYFFFSLVMLRRDARLTKYQSQIFQVMFLWMFFCVLEITFARHRTPQTLLVCVPPVAYFVNHYLLLIQRRWIAESMLWVFIIGVLTMNSVAIRTQFVSVDYSKMFMNSPGAEYKDKRVMVLTDDLSPLASGKPAGIFLEWRLAEPVFDEPAYYEHLSPVARAFKIDPPDLVLDPNNKLEAFFKFLPDVQAHYKKYGDRYKRIKQ